MPISMDEYNKKYYSRSTQTKSPKVTQAPIKKKKTLGERTLDGLKEGAKNLIPFYGEVQTAKKILGVEDKVSQKLADTANKFGMTNLEGGKVSQEDVRQTAFAPYMIYKQGKDLIKGESKLINYEALDKYTSKQKEIMSDGYQFGDVTKGTLNTLKTAGTTGGELVSKFGKGMLNASNNLGYFLAYMEDDKLLNYAKTARQLGFNKVADKFESIANLSLEQMKEHPNFYEDINKFARENSEAIDTIETYIEENSISGETLDSVTESMGESYANAQVGTAIGGSNGLNINPNEIAQPTSTIGKILAPDINMPITSFTGGYVNARQEAQQNGMSIAQQQRAGVMGGTIEAFTEGIFGQQWGNGTKLGGSSIDDVIDRQISKVSSPTIRSILKLYTQARGEGAEEKLSYSLNYLFKKIDDKITTLQEGKDAKLYDAKFNLGEYNEQGFSGFLSGLGSGISSYNNVLNQEKNIESVTSEITPVIEETLSSIDGTNVKLDTEDKMVLRNAIEEEIENASKEGREFNGQRLLETYLNNQMKGYVLVNEMLESANKYSKSKLTSEDLKTISKIIKDKEIRVVFDDTIKDEEGNEVNGLARNDNGQATIVLNPNSESAMEFLVMHELEHVLNTKGMNKLIDQFMNNHPELRKASESLNENYSEGEIQEEITSDVTAELFGDKNFINSLSTENPNLFESIKGIITSLKNRAYKGSNEKVLLQALENKFRSDYRTQNNNLGEDTRFAKNEENNYNTSKKKVKFKDNQEMIDEYLFKKDMVRVGDKTLVYNNEGKLSKIYNHNNGKTIERWLNSGNKINSQNRNVGRISLQDSFNNGIQERNDLSNGRTDSGQTTSTNQINQILNNYGFEENEQINDNSQDRGNFLGYATEEEYKDWVKINDYIIDSLYKDMSSQGIANFEDETINYQNEVTKKEQEKVPFSNEKKYSKSTPAWYEELENIAPSKTEEFKKYYLPMIEERYQNEDKTKIKETIEELKALKETINPDESDDAWSKYFQANAKIQALENGYDTIYDYYVNRDMENALKEYERYPDNIDRTINEAKATEEKNNKLQQEIENAPKFKVDQYNIIQETNPMFDDYHVGIRSPQDIKTFEEAMQQAEEDGDGYAWGDFNKEDAERVLKKNSVTIYSSYPIKNGVFVSTSYIQAQEYAGGEGNRVYSKTIKPERVAWISVDEGQYASVNTKYSKTNETWNNALDSIAPIHQELTIEEKINQSMTMDEARRMIQMAFNDNGIKDWYDGKYQNGDEWLEGEGADEVAMYVENTESSITKYLNPLVDRDESYDNGDYVLEEIIDAYQNGTLIGTQKQSRVNLDTSIENNFEDNRFYAPQKIDATMELYNKANQRVTNSNREEVYKARADFVIAVHNPSAIENLGLDVKEINKKLRDWTSYTKEARELSQRVNEGVARQNQWSGLENSSIVNQISVTNEQMESLVKEVKGDSSGFQRKYITSAMLAIDTHIDYSNLTFEFDQLQVLKEGKANGDYNYKTDTIRVGDANQHTIAHEMGHYIDYQWAREICGINGAPFSEIVNRNNLNLNTEQQNFVNNFKNFIKDISESATLGSEYSSRDSSYWQRNTEVFARFVAKFTEWTKNKASNGRYDYESRYGNFGDNFTTSQYMEFIKLLQEKSSLDTTNQNQLAPLNNEDGNIEKQLSKNASIEIDKVLKDTSIRTPVKLRDNTPQILVKNGLKDLEMYENPSHIRKNILTEQEAKNIGLSVQPNDHYHGLGKQIYLDAIDNLDNPRVVFKNNNNDDYLILTTSKDNKGNVIVVPIQIETTTKVNNITIDTNRIKSVYGYDRQKPDLNKYIKDNINLKVFTKIYEQKKNPSTSKTSQLSSDALILPQNEDNVNYNKNTPVWQQALESIPTKGTTTKMSDIFNGKYTDTKNIAPTIDTKLNYTPISPTKVEAYDEKNYPNIKEQAKEEGIFVADKTEPSKFRNMVDDFQEKFTNRNHYADKLAKKTNNLNITYKGDMANNAMNEAEYNIKHVQTDLNGNEIGKGVEQIFQPSRDAGEYDAFNDYLFHKSNIERHREGKGSEVPSNVSEKLIQDYEKTYPEFIQWSNDVYTYYRNVLQNQVDAGLVSKDLQALLSERYQNYVPFYEIKGADTKEYYDDKGEIKPVTTIKYARGGANQANIMNFEESMKRQTYAYRQAIRDNNYRMEIGKTLGGEVPLTPPERLYVSDMSNMLYKDDGKFYLTYLENGNEHSVQINKEMYDELNKTNENRIKELEEKFSPITKPIQKANDIRRNILTTWNPVFTLVYNPLKDIQETWFNSKHWAGTTWNMIKAPQIELLRGKSQDAKTFMALYGGDIKSMTKNPLKWIGRGYSNLSEAIELAPRFAEFKASLKAGESVEQALYNAREVTTNFSRGGYVTKALNRNGFTFLNASVQGLSKIGRNVQEHPIQSLGRAVIFGVAPALFNELEFGSGDDKDEEYEALPDYIKDNYYLVGLDKNDNYLDNSGMVIEISGRKFLRIPKGRIASVIGSLARRSVEFVEGDENAYDGYLENAWSQVGVGDLGGGSNSDFNILNQTMLAPINQAFGSKNGTAWYGDDIVPTRLQEKPDAQQYDEKTDELSKQLGKWLNLSPYKINYVIDQYSGGIGDIFLPMITEESKNGAETPLEYLTAPIKDKFIVNSVDDNKYAKEFYDKLDELKVKSNSDYATDEDILNYMYMASKSSEMGKLYQEKRAIQSNSNLSKKEKYARVQVIQDQINNIARESMSEYTNQTRNSNYARVEDIEYYKNNDNEWKRVSEADAEDTALLGMTDSEKNNYYITKNTILDYTSYYNDLNENANETLKALNNSEKKLKITQAITSCGLTDAQKGVLYNKYYGSEKTMTKITNANIDFNTYANAEIKIDELKNTYSKENGYSTDQRRSVVQQYINSLNLDIGQKLIMQKVVGGYSVKSYKNYLYDYIDQLDLSTNEKQELFNSLF